MHSPTAALGQQQAKTSNVMGFKYNITHLPGFLSSPREQGYTHKEGPLLQLDGWDGKSLPALF